MFNNFVLLRSISRYEKLGDSEIEIKIATEALNPLKQVFLAGCALQSLLSSK